MGIGELKRWQWAVIGGVVGTLLALGRPPADPTEGVRSAGPEQFERELGRDPLRSGATFVANIVVYPSREGGYLVRFDWLTPSNESQGWRYVPWCMDAGKEYKAQLDPVAGTETVMGFLDRTAKTYPHVRYRYAWWAEPRWWFVLWVGGGAVVLGGIWPAVLRRLIGSSGVVEEETAWAGPVGVGGDGAVAAAPATMSEADEASLAAVNRGLEEGLGGFGADGVGEKAESVGGQPPVVTLSGGPVEAVPAGGERSGPQEYAGEFYPVARKGGPKDESAEGSG